MPIPGPKKDEKEDKYISRCMLFHDNEGKFNLKDKEQREHALAICYSIYSAKKESNDNLEKIFKETLKD